MRQVRQTIKSGVYISKCLIATYNLRNLLAEVAKQMSYEKKTCVNFSSKNLPFIAFKRYFMFVVIVRFRYTSTLHGVSLIQ